MSIDLQLARISTTDRLQPRYETNMNIVDDYAQAMKQGQIFPPVEVVFDGENHWLWDGFHRKRAAEAAGLETISANITEGNLTEAEWLALGANKIHGFQRSNKDKRRAVTLAFEHSKVREEVERAKKPNYAQIADHCGVSEYLVRNLWLELNPLVRLSRNIENPIETDFQKRLKHLNGHLTHSHPTESITPQARQLVTLSDHLLENRRELEQLAKLEPERQVAIAELIANGQVETVAGAQQKLARQRIPEPATTPSLPHQKYRCIVIDPPWPMKKIEREERPNQGIELDYPTMSLEEIEALPITELADDSGCHLYLWVTQKYLPAGLQLVEKWGFNYQCLMTWRKNVGITPYSWMYDTEHVIFARRGNLPLQRLGLRLSFDAPVNGHSVKPETFFTERAIPASPEPRLEMFARKPREGFEVWGNELSKFE